MGQLNESQANKLNKYVFGKAMVIGVFGGIIWSALFVGLFAFKMIEIDPVYPLQIVFGDMASFKKWYAYLFVILVNGILSLIIAMGYYFTLKKQPHWIVGALYGVFWWGVLMLVVPRWINGGNMHPAETYIATFAVFLLYGVFIGYSISFEYKNAMQRKMG